MSHKTRILSFLLAGTLLLSGCVAKEAEEETRLPSVPAEEAPQPQPEEEPSDPQPQEEPAPESEEEPSQTPTEAPTEETPAEEPPTEEISAPEISEKSAEDGADLPRNLYNLPMPMTGLEEEYVSLCLPECERVDDSYFEGAVFLGDSVTLGLKKYVTKMRKSDPDFLSDARFIAVGSYGVYEALLPPGEETMHELYEGVQTQPQDILAAWGAKTVFIWMGLNDAGLFSLDENMENYAELITRIRIANPSIRIIILPTTPMTVEGERKSLYNYRIDEYNRAVMKLAARYGCYYCYIAEALKDSEGYLPEEYSSDNYVHLVYEAYDLVLDYIRTHAVTPEIEEDAGTVLLPAAEKEGYEGNMGSY